MPDLPNGFDRADGIDGRIGTPTPNGSVLVTDANGTSNIEDISINEEPDSPTIERAEQATLTKRFRLAWNEAVSRLGSHGRGTIQVDSVGNETKILSAEIQRQKGGYAILKIVSEGLSFDTPPDELQIVPVELGVNIMKHPRYFYAFLGDGAGSATEKINQQVIKKLQDYFENVNSQSRNTIIGDLNRSLGHDNTDGYIHGTDMAKRAALEIVQKYWRGEETPYVVGWQITWSVYYRMPQNLNPGGYTENPMTEAAPQLPDYFFSTVFPPDPSFTIFDFMDYANPQCYSVDGARGGGVNISWLRKSDQMDYQRTWFKVERTWIGSPVGFWDTELYTSDERPSKPSDYLVVNESTP